jgi:ring-1,2-phenylacetyl-CoA epoxidase subunit PaaB
MSNDNQFPLWEVFVQAKSGTPYKHAGSVHAADKEMALMNARDLYSRRNEGTAILSLNRQTIKHIVIRLSTKFLLK